MTWSAGGELIARLLAAHRENVVTEWRAAIAAGLDVRIAETREAVMAAAPALPGHAFNSAFGMTRDPAAMAVAVEFFAAHGVDGYVVLGPNGRT